MLGRVSVKKAMNNYKFNKFYKQSAFYTTPRSRRIKSKKRGNR